jgi:hypothetical protein
MVKITSEQIEFSTSTQQTEFPYIGTILLWAGDDDTNIDDYLLCKGQAVKITEYQELYKIIGNTYKNSGNTDATTFNVPDFKKQIPLGADNSTSISYNSTVYGGDSVLKPEHNRHTHAFTITRAVNWGRRGAESGGPKDSTCDIYYGTMDIVIPTNSSGTSKAYYPKYCIVNYIIRAK